MESQTNPHGAGATARAVADDMAAIFGPDGRATADAPVTERAASARPVKLNRALLAISAGTLAATIAAGLYVGKSVIATPLATPALRVEVRAPQAVGRRAPGAAPVVADAVLVPPALSPSVAIEAAPISPRGTTPLPVAPASPAQQLAGIPQDQRQRRHPLVQPRFHPLRTLLPAMHRQRPLRRPLRHRLPPCNHRVAMRIATRASIHASTLQSGGLPTPMNRRSKPACGRVT